MRKHATRGSSAQATVIKVWGDLTRDAEWCGTVPTVSVRVDGMKATFQCSDK